MDMPIEIAVFLGVGVLLIGIVLSIVFYWDIDQDVDSLVDDYGEGIVSDDQLKVSFDEFAMQANYYWSECLVNESMYPGVFYVYNETDVLKGDLTKETLFSYYKSLNLCNTLQSKEQSCGGREDINMGDILLPSIVKLNCSDYTLNIYE